MNKQETLNQIVAFAVKNTWLSREYSDFGWGNGYVVIPEGHPWYDKEYSDECYQNVDVNGGLTFSEIIKDHAKLPEAFKPHIGKFVIGFDTCHSWDSERMWPDEYSVLCETERLREQVASALLNSDKNVQVSDTTKDASSN